MERAIQEKIVRHMNSMEMFHPNQQAYRKGYITTSAMFQLVDQLFEAAENKEIGIALWIDQYLVFESINHQILDE